MRRDTGMPAIVLGGLLLWGATLAGGAATAPIDENGTESSVDYPSLTVARGWAIHVLLTDTSGCPEAALDRSLRAAGWVYARGYQGDGPDGTVLGLSSRKYLCVLEAEWDGEDDSDSTYVPAPGCEVTVTCVPRNALDDPERAHPRPGVRTRAPREGAGRVR